jgi:hypothetical protein
MTFAVSGVFCASATPLAADLSPDLAAFAAHCQTLLDDGCDGIALLGTTGEANSFSSAERRAILEAALASGIAPSRLLPGTGLANVPETVELTRHALSCGVTTVVMLPPFYYKGVSDDGLFRSLCRCDRTHRRSAAAGDPVSHPADDRPADQPRSDRAPGDRLPRNRHRHQGFRRQDREHGGDDRPVPRLCGAGRRRPAASAADAHGGRGLHHRYVEPGGTRAGLRLPPHQ